METSVQPAAAAARGMLAALFVALTAAVAAAQDTDTCPPPPPAGPDFCRVSDILDGQRRLLPEDDLLVTWQPQSGGTWSSIESIVGKTSDIAVSSFSNDAWVSSTGGFQPFGAAVGRVFNLKTDVSVTMASNGVWINDPGAQQTYGFANPFGVGPAFAAFPPGTTVQPLAPINRGLLKLADITGDGFAEVIVGLPGVGLAVGTAVNTDDASKGLQWGKPLGGLVINPLSALTLGDFNGDGQRDIALAYQGLNGVAVVQTFSVITDPNNANYLSPVSAGQATTNSFYEINSISLAAGNFDGAPPQGTAAFPTDELILVLSELTIQGGIGPQVTVVVLQTNDDLQPGIVNQDTTISFAGASSWAGGVSTVLESGRVDWFGGGDQAMLGVTAFAVGDLVNTPLFYPVSFAVVLKLDSGLNPQWSGPTKLQSVTIGPDFNRCVSGLRGLAIGNFGQDIDETTPPNLQIAVLQDFTLVRAAANQICGNADTSVFVDFYTVDPSNNFALSLVNTSTAVSGEPSGAYQMMTIAAGDIQGRSMLLGPPTRVRVEGHIQPDIVLGVPPMHVDYIPPQAGADPAVVNVSVAPQIAITNQQVKGFASTYNFGTGTSGTTTQQSTTSFTLSTKESVDDKVSYGVPDVASVSVSYKVAAQQTHDKTVSQKYQFTNSNQTSMTATTGLADRVWFAKKDFYVYTYPVLGQEVCPSGSSGCPDSEKLPLLVHFSGPVEIEVATRDANVVTMDADGLEWYQPVHEPGNLLSYPWRVDVIKQEVAGLSALTNPQAEFVSPGTSVTSFSSTWTTGTTQDQSVGSSNKQSLDVSVSIAANASIEGFGANTSESFDVNASEAVSTLNTTASSVSESQGVSVDVPALSTDNWAISEYAYQFAGYIFGQEPPEGTFDGSQPATDQQTSGIQQLRFAAQPTADLWELIYTQPDVALNHPERWSWDQKALVASLNAPQMDAIVTSPFHAMRGFFITRVGDATAVPTGSQLTVAEAGDQLALWTRVYNYSMADMPAGATIRARFYGQVFDPQAPECQDTPQPPNCQFVGASFPVAEVGAPPLPGYPTPDEVATQTALNWQLVTATWGTEPDSSNPNWGCGPVGGKTSCAGEQVLFWVVVWMEDSAGDLVAEMPGHGLSDVPDPSLADITQVPLEQVTVNGQSISFSNNVGIYNQPIYVCDPDSDCGFPNLAATSAAGRGTAAGPAAAARQHRPGDGDLWVDRLSFRRVAQRQKKGGRDLIKVRAVIASGEQPFRPVSVFFYDGHPSRKGTAFDHVLIPHLPPNSRYVVETNFSSDRCGSHDVYVLTAASGLPPAIGGNRVVIKQCGRFPPRQRPGTAQAGKGDAGPGPAVLRKHVEAASAKPPARPGEKSRSGPN